MAPHAPDGEVRAAGALSAGAPAGPGPRDRKGLHGLGLRGLVALLLAGITLLLYLGIGRFVPDGPDLLPPFAAGDAGSGWAAGGDVLPAGSEGIALGNGDPAGSATLSIILQVPPGVRYLDLAADVRLHDVVGGLQPWESGRLILLSRADAASDWRYDLPHTVIRTTGSMAWRRVDRAFLVPDRAEVRVAVQLLRSTGRLWVRNLSLRPAAERAWFPPVAALLVLSWLLAGAWILWPLAAPFVAAMRSGRPTRRHLRSLAVLLAILAITVGVLVPPEGKQLVRDAAGAIWSTGRGLVTAGQVAAPPAQCDLPSPGSSLAHLKPLQPQPPSAALPAAAAAATDQDFVASRQLRWLVADKLGHVAGFALLAFLALWAAQPLRWQGGLLLLAGLPGFAALTEIWQVMVTTRGASLTDVGVDIAGLTLGASAWALLQALLRARRRWRGGALPG